MKLITTYISRRSRLGGESSRQGPWQACLLYVSPCFLRTPSSPHLYTGLEGAPTLLSTRTGGCHVRAVLVWKIIRFCIVCFWPELGMFFFKKQRKKYNLNDHSKGYSKADPMRYCTILSWLCNLVPMIPWLFLGNICKGKALGMRLASPVPCVTCCVTLLRRARGIYR